MRISYVVLERVVFRYEPNVGYDVVWLRSCVRASKECFSVQEIIALRYIVEIHSWSTRILRQYCSQEWIRGRAQKYNFSGNNHSAFSFIIHYEDANVLLWWKDFDFRKTREMLSRTLWLNRDRSLTISRKSPRCLEMIVFSGLVLVRVSLHKRTAPTEFSFIPLT